MPENAQGTNAGQAQGAGGMPTPTPQGDSVQGAQGKKTVPANFSEFLATQPVEIKELYEQDVHGLKGAYKSQQEEAKKLDERLKGITKLLGTDPEKAKSEMDKLSTDLQEANRKIEFLQDAGKPEIECLDTNLAWLLATSKGLFRANGSPDWPAIRKEAPRLFGKPVVEINAGAGTGNGAGGKANMDDWIRNLAGVW